MASDDDIVFDSDFESAESIDMSSEHSKGLEGEESSDGLVESPKKVIRISLRNTRSNSSPMEIPETQKSEIDFEEDEKREEKRRKRRREAKDKMEREKQAVIDKLLNKGMKKQRIDKEVVEEKPKEICFDSRYIDNKRITLLIVKDVKLEENEVRKRKAKCSNCKSDSKFYHSKNGKRICSLECYRKVK